METALAGWLGARAVHVPPPWPASLGCARSDPTSAPTWPAAGLGVPPMWAWFKTDLVAGSLDPLADLELPRRPGAPLACSSRQGDPHQAWRLILVDRPIDRLARSGRTAWNPFAGAWWHFPPRLFFFAGPSPGPHLAMPAGVSLPTYLKMVAASLGAMLLGAEVVHRYYRPDLTIPEVPPKRGELKTELLGLKTRQEQGQISQQQ
ncbi:uncharacterized protein LOC100618869 isoform X1 [Monodelphis domestica]|uniref:uncharacterized protein LOC100618869 isoform X1 n=2 Tax=Didelphinae TaxID=126287 RepID=UPI0004435635|nr:uncharacterized protein LOC100618869 isoform X1 [Monodelphis domestica]